DLGDAVLEVDGLGPVAGGEPHAATGLEPVRGLDGGGGGVPVGLDGGGDVGGDAPGAQGGGDVVAQSPLLLVRHGDEDGGGYRPGGRGEPGAEDPGDETGHADGQPDARVGAGAVGGEGVVPAAGADGTEVLVADEGRLVDRAGVVVQAARDGQVGDDGVRH